MEVTVDIPGDDTRIIEMDGGSYADLVRAVDLRPQEVAVIVDGQPVPEDREIDAEHVTIVRLIAGGSVEIRSARDDEAEDVIAILDGAMLAIDRRDIRRRTGSHDVLVAVEDGEIKGALVLDDEEINAIAVLRAVRDGGIGRSLVREATARRGDLSARFDERVRPFWEAVGFDVQGGRERYVGTYTEGVPDADSA